MKFPKIDKFDMAVVALTICMYLLVLSLSFSSSPLGDLDFYLEAKTLAGYLRGYEPLENVGMTKAPGPIFFYLIPYLFVPYESPEHIYWLTGVIWTSIFMVICILMLRRAGRNMFNDLTGKIACILSIIFPLHLYYTFSIAAESLGYIGSICMLYGFSVWYKNGYSRWYRSGGWWLLFFGMMALLLSRPTMFLIIPLVVAAFAIAWFSRNYRIRAITKPIIILLVFVSIAYFGIINFARQFPGKRDTYRQAEYLTYIMHMGRFQFRTEPFDWRFWDNDYREGSVDYQMWVESQMELNSLVSGDMSKYNEVYRPWIINDVMHNKLNFMKQFLVRTLNGQFMFVNSVAPSNFTMIGFKGPVAYYCFHFALNIINIIILISCIVFLIRERKRLAEFWILWAPVLAIILFHAAVYMEPRYMFSGRSFMLMMAAYVLSTLFAKFRNPFRKTGAVYDSGGIEG